MFFGGSLTDPNVAELWATLPAITFVVLLVIFSLPIPLPPLVSKILARVRAPFLPTLTLREAEELQRQFVLDDAEEGPRSDQRVVSEQPQVEATAPRWRTFLFAGLALLEIVAWLGVEAFKFSFDKFGHLPWTSFLVSLTWVYALVHVLHRPPITPPFDLFILFILHFLGGVLTLGRQLYVSATCGVPLPHDMILTAEGVHFGILIILLLLLVRLPLNIPSSDVDREKIPILSPEDYTSLAGWMTFSWVRPLVVTGTSKKLNDEDVWDTSSTLKTRPTFFSYQHTPGSSILWRLLRANSMDLIIDFLLTELSVVLEFASPFFLRAILEGLEGEPSGSRGKLYMYAVLSFLANLLKAESDLQHLWHCRRAAMRVTTQLSAAIYDKAVRITDQSGVTATTFPSNADTKEVSELNGKPVESNDDPSTDAKKIKRKDGNNKTIKDKDEEKDDDEAGADVGKIVNLMAIDAVKIQTQVVVMQNIYSAPLQLVLSCMYLYNLLGVSAFAGFASLLLALPLSRLLANAVMRITKGTLAAKDARMKLVNEMFGSIKFIKFFAWEDQWIKKIMDARMVEMKWLKKGRNVNIWYSLLWLIVPTIISVASFFVFIVTGHELSVSVAFTAIRLFDMLRMPLGMLPYAMVTFAQTKVSLDRLTAFFNEGEVPADVCSLTRSATSEPQEARIEHGTFRWTKGGKSGEGVKAKAKKDTSVSAFVPDSVPSNENGATMEGTDDDDAAAAVSISTRTAVNRERDGDQVFELKDISLRLIPGKLTVVTGPTASGKTALLMALLGEMDRISGSASIPKNPTIVDEHGLRNSISYAAQTPWLQQQSIKDNIVFEYPFNKERYDAVIEACALNPDFQSLEDGDLTEIGSKGVSLSGGQKARVALARAVYAPTQYLILDDIFSAVDSHTARFLFERLLQGPLVAHRTVLLVTHHVELVLPGTHYLIQLLEGRIHQQGTVEELKEQGLLDYIAHDSALRPQHDKDETLVEEMDGGKNSNTSQGAVGGDTKAKQARKLVEDEERAEGGVRWSIYKTYLKASSYWTWICVCLGIIAAESCDVGTRVWMSIWGSAYNQLAVSFITTAFSRATSHFQALNEPWPMKHHLVIHNATQTQDVIVNSLPNAHHHPLFYVGVYCGIGLASTFVAVVTEWALFTGGLRGGLMLFKNLLHSLSVATFRFFDTTPTGRILNRFSKDFDMLDGMLPFMLHHVTTSLASFLGAVITVGVVVPWFLPVGALLAYCYVRLSLGYLETGRDLRRMESTSRSPILAGFSDLVSGIVTVRAFSAERQFLKGHYERVDTTNRFWYFTWMLNRWLLLHFEALSASSVFLSTMFVLAAYIPAGFAALSIVSAMTFSMSVYWACRGFTELELCLNAVERVVEYLDVPKEPPAFVESHRVPAYWPSSSDSQSMLVVENLEVKYAPDLPPVLHDISFSLKARERVGLLGRTGCGKSTLAMSLLRFVDPVKGKILIDGIDITSIGTRDLRSRVTFIPQDATLFAGTIRNNLDPFEEHTDAECLDALVRVHLVSPSSQRSSRVPSRAPSIDGDQDENVASSPTGSDTTTQIDVESKIIINLDTTVSDGGQNFSNGQRQLLAMARALLRQSGVVILDEATSSIDKAADVKIQAAIREEFNRSLLLTVAHRLGTIIDFDRLIVLDKGRIVEFDTPYNLIRKEGGIFREMCIQSGTYKELEAAAKAQAEQESK